MIILIHTGHGALAFMFLVSYVGVKSCAVVGLLISIFGVGQFFKMKSKEKEKIAKVQIKDLDTTIMN